MLRSSLAAILLLAAPGLALAESKTMGHSGHVATSPSDAAYAAAMNTMMKTMMVEPSGDADRDFVRMMLPHHQGAVDMAQVELKYGRDPELLKLARAVTDAQTKEMAAMREWLSKHGK